MRFILFCKVFKQLCTNPGHEHDGHEKDQQNNHERLLRPQNLLGYCCRHVTTRKPGDDSPR